MSRARRGGRVLLLQRCDERTGQWPGTREEADYSDTVRVRNARAAADELLILGSLAPQHGKPGSASMGLL